ncbi:hypothetical protein VNO77_44488 [Canavalia gladiata]|uniref:Uncharacterized protein n=1 Tax=Canavalia gladiata TaxID=3824 RepID=A0AAN9JYK9_CANGL
MQAGVLLLHILLILLLLHILLILLLLHILLILSFRLEQNRNTKVLRSPSWQTITKFGFWETRDDTCGLIMQIYIVRCKQNPFQDPYDSKAQVIEGPMAAPAQPKSLLGLTLLAIGPGLCPSSVQIVICQSCASCHVLLQQHHMLLLRWKLSSYSSADAVKLGKIPRALRPRAEFSN